MNEAKSSSDPDLDSLFRHNSEKMCPSDTGSSHWDGSNCSVQHKSAQGLQDEDKNSAKQDLDTGDQPRFDRCCIGIERGSIDM